MQITPNDRIRPTTTPPRGGAQATYRGASTARAVEILTTCALAAGMHVVDRDDPAAGEHTLARKPVNVGGGQYHLTGTDGWSDVRGARHAWQDVTP